MSCSPHLAQSKSLLWDQIHKTKHASCKNPPLSLSLSLSRSCPHRIRSSRGQEARDTTQRCRDHFSSRILLSSDGVTYSATTNTSLSRNTSTIACRTNCSSTHGASRSASSSLVPTSRRQRPSPPSRPTISAMIASTSSARSQSRPDGRVGSLPRDRVWRNGRSESLRGMGMGWVSERERESRGSDGQGVIMTSKALGVYTGVTTSLRMGILWRQIAHIFCGTFSRDCLVREA